jgi:cytochrome P450
VTAGTETTGLTLTTTTFHLLAEPSVLTKLQAELREHFPVCNEVISYRELEKLPFLTACINEGLRLASGVSGRLPRVDPHGATQYGQYTLPPGTAISMSIRDIHYDPSIFPDPTAFKPERWLENSDNARRLKERFLVPFGKGARSCVGSSLAMAELFAVIGNVFRRFPDMQLYETTRADVDMALDLFSPVARLDSKGLRVMVK